MLYPLTLENKGFGKWNGKEQREFDTFSTEPDAASLLTGGNQNGQVRERCYGSHGRLTGAYYGKTRIITPQAAIAAPAMLWL